MDPLKGRQMNNADSMQVAQVDFEAALRTLDENKQRWVEVTVAERIQLLERIKDGLMPVSRGWAEAAARKKGVDPALPVAGEEWISGPQALMGYCNSLILTLKKVVGHRHLDAVPMRTLPNGQLAAKVFPQTLWDHLLLSGVTAEVWMQPGITQANLAESTALIYNSPTPTQGKVSLVLGAGNIAAIAPLDCLHKLFVDNHVVILKTNPVNEFLTDFLEPAFAPLIERGFLRIVRGDILVGQFLSTHPLVEVLHITGSGTAHDEIVWGIGNQAMKNKQAGTPRNPRPITSELGGVAPTIVVPGPWSKADIAFQAAHVATQKLHNAGFNCIACQVLVLPKQWPQKMTFVRKLQKSLAASTPRPIFYPGSKARLRNFKDLIKSSTSAAPKTSNQCLVVGFEPGKGHPFESVEVFGPGLAVTELPSPDAESFLIAAIAYANEHLEGTLGANIVIHPKTMAQIGRKRFDEIVADLRYGCIGVNAWTGLGFLLGPVPWGAFPGHKLDHIESGIGFVHNTLLFDKPQRTVVEAPFKPFPRNLLSGAFTLLPRPPWFIDNPRARTLGKLLTRFHHRPSLAKLPRIFMNALLG
jgi:acyl-CoA reductase-like NAD-dependent aldehyde dehydrogenase